MFRVSFFVSMSFVLLYRVREPYLITSMPLVIGPLRAQCVANLFTVAATALVYHI